MRTSRIGKTPYLPLWTRPTVPKAVNIDVFARLTRPGGRVIGVPSAIILGDCESGIGSSLF
jgi:hypothetical protein